MKTLRYILVFVLVQLTLGGMAQFRKALPLPRKQSDEAMFNLGIIAGPSFTHWHHLNSTESEEWFMEDYDPTLQLGYTGGLSLEATLTKHWSLGISALYTQHGISMQYTNEQFPYDWDNGILYSRRQYDIEADYQTIAMVVPLTYYFYYVKDPFRPYVFVAPRFSYILKGEFHQTITDYFPITDETHTVADPKALLAPDNHISFNIGATVGLGALFRIDLDYYYFLIKLETTTDWSLKNSFTKKQLENEFNNKRYDADAAATVSFIFPLKMIMKDACYLFR